MTNRNLDPQQLIEQFLLGKLSVSEEKELLNWIERDPGNMRFFLQEQERLKPIIQTRRDKTTDKYWNRLLKRIEYEPVIAPRKKRKSILIGASAIAASLVLGIIIYSTNSFNSTDTKKVLASYKSVTTPLGTKTDITLPDGSTVNLNSGSTLRYPEKFTETERKVELSGEAFFDVVHNSVQPFIVKTEAINVRVLGTAFNVEAFPGAEEINTTLVRGKVILEKEVDNKTTSLTEMNPNERVVFKLKDQNMSLSKETNLEQYIAWKDKKLVFLNDPIEEVAKKLERWYNVSVVIKSEDLKKSHFTGTFTDETIERVLTLLSVSSPIDYKIDKTKNTRKTDSLQQYRIILSSRN